MHFGSVSAIRRPLFKAIKATADFSEITHKHDPRQSRAFGEHFSYQESKSPSIRNLYLSTFNQFPEDSEAIFSNHQTTSRVHGIFFLNQSINRPSFRIELRSVFKQVSEYSDPSLIDFQTPIRSIGKRFSATPKLQPIARICPQSGLKKGNRSRVNSSIDTQSITSRCCRVFSNSTIICPSVRQSVKNNDRKLSGTEIRTFKMRSTNHMMSIFSLLSC